MKFSRHLFVIPTALLLSHSLQAAKPERWYTQEDVTRGARVFAESCAACHGTNAEATPDWRKPGPDGAYPPPPLDGTAHAWHHPMDVLRRTIREGGAKVGGKMPAFQGKLTPAEIDAAIAYFQSKWPDKVYSLWQERGQGSSQLPTIQPATKEVSTATRYLSRRLKETEISSPMSTPVAGVVQVKVGGSYVYLTEDGRYAFTGDLVDLKTGENLTASKRARDTQALVAGFPEEMVVTFPAKGEEQAVVTVFTDTSCPYCRKLHAEVPQLQASGVSVRYIPYPRGGRQGDGYAGLKSVWCAEDPLAAMDIAKGVKGGDLPAGNCDRARAVDAGYELGNKVGVQGTPSLVLPDGRKVDGYVPASRLLSVLGLSANSTATSNQ